MPRNFYLIQTSSFQLSRCREKSLELFMELLKKYDIIGNVYLLDHKCFIRLAQY